MALNKTIIMNQLPSCPMGQAHYTKFWSIIQAVGGDCTDWKQEAERLKFDENKSWTDITKTLWPHFPSLSFEQVREKIRGELRRSERYAPAKPKPQKKERPPKIDIIQNFEPSKYEVDWKGNRIVRLGLIGDTHINSKYTQITHLHAFYDECQRQGIKHVYHAGDIDEGEQMRPGHQYELYQQGADDHVSEIARVYPRKVGITTHFITGNHDASIHKRCGYNIGPAISSKRSDMKYLGQDCSIVKLTPNCTLELRHPWTGSAYAISYQPQKMIEAMAGGEKPSIIGIGHFHKSEYLFYRNVHAFQTGTFEAQTPFMRGKGLSAHMGGWIIEAYVHDDGSVERIKQEFIPFYQAIQEDYKNWL